MGLKLFVDFDGTMTQGEVGSAFFREFGGRVCDTYERACRRGEMSASESVRLACGAIGNLNLSSADSFLHQQRVDPGLGEFIARCREWNVDVMVVSDGLDHHVRTILDEHGLGALPSIANHAILRSTEHAGTSTLSVTFPHSDAECTRCSCCKRNAMLTRAGEDDAIVYVGDGYSDECPVRYADIVFAKGELQAFCQRENISYYEYRSFFDVTARLAGIVSGRTPRKRQSAALRRKEAFQRES